MNKKTIITVIISILIIVVLYFLIWEVQSHIGNNEGSNDKVQILTDEKNKLVLENEKLQMEFNKELNKLLDELEESQNISARSIKFAEETEQKMKDIIEASKKLSYPDEASIYILKEMGIEDYSVLKDSLSELGEDIIGYKGILGGNMHFVSVKILNDRWAFARFEDGHYGGYGIYNFKIVDDDILWNTVAEYSDN